MFSPHTPLGVKHVYFNFCTEKIESGKQHFAVDFEILDMSISKTVYTEITVNKKEGTTSTIYSTLLSSYLLISFNSLDSLKLCLPQFIHSVDPPVFLTDKVPIHSHWELSDFFYSQYPLSALSQTGTPQFAAHFMLQFEWSITLSC